MVLFLIGLGLGDEKDVTLRGLEAVKKSSRVFLEAYTSILVEKERLEADSILEGAEHDNIAFLIVGDPFGATTHTDLQLRAKAKGIQVKVVHNASIMNAVGCCGLQLYRFGEAVSIVFFTDTWRPDSFYPRILANRKQGLHTLCLLDIKVKEPTLESLARGKKVYEPSRFMTIGTAIEQLLEIEENIQGGAYGEDSLCVGLARVGAEDQQIVAGSMKELLSVDFGPPLHSFIIAGERHILEDEVLELYKV